MPAATRWHAEQNKLLSAAAPENCSSATKIQRRTSFLQVDTKETSTWHSYLLCFAWQLTAHLFCWRVGAARLKRGQSKQGALSGWRGGTDLAQQQSTLNGCCHHRGAGQSCCSIYVLKKKSWLLMLLKTLLRQKLISHWNSVCRSAGHGNRGKGVNKCLFFSFFFFFYSWWRLNCKEEKHIQTASIE